MVTVLTPVEIVGVLLRQGLIDPALVCNSDLTVTDASRRSCNTIVTSSHRPSYFVKQCLEDDGSNPIRTEATIYQLASTDLAFGDLRHYLPKFFGFDQASELLVLEWLAHDAEDLERYYARGRFSLTLARETAAALACLHTVNLSDQSCFALEDVAGLGPPWVFSILRPSISQYHSLSFIETEMIRILQKFPILSDLLDECILDWHVDGLIHGDIKWSNFLAVSARDSGRKSRIKVIDWENACFGDPCWDVAGVFSAYVTLWLASVSTDGRVVAPETERQCRTKFHITAMQPAIRAFWYQYCLKLAPDISTADEMLLRSVKFCAVRMLQTSMELTEAAGVVTANVIYMLQLATNMLQRPLEAIVFILGLKLTEGRASYG